MDPLQRWARSGRSPRRVGAVLLAVGLAVTLVACGDGSGSRSAPAAVPTATSAPVAAHRYPSCARVWRTGHRLPARYRACRAGDVVAHDRRRSCSSGQVVVLHRARWYAVAGGPINRVAGDHPARRMRALIRSCTG
ncbi:MAG: hypothetical protein ACTHJH_13730 [Marmoricola sp.]